MIKKNVEKIIKKGLAGSVIAAWRKLIRRTIIGNLIAGISGGVLVEKLVNAPRLGYWPQIRNPRSFNEKIMHRKLLTDRDIYAKVSNKSKVKKFVKKEVGREVLPRLYCTQDNLQGIPFEELPQKFVIKTGNKGVVIVDKNKQSKTDIINECRKKMETIVGKYTGEYWYRKYDPKVLVEERLFGVRQEIPIDYKFFTFDGEVEYIQVDMDRFSNHSRRIYDSEWNSTNIRLEYPLGPTIKKPNHFEEMKEIAERLGSSFDFVRVDLYETVNNGVTFGELTLAPGEGAERFIPRKYDFEFGKCWGGV